METNERGFIRFGQLMNVVIAVGLLVLLVKTFSEPRRQSEAYAIGVTPTAAAIVATVEPHAAEPTTLPTVSVPTTTALPTVPPATATALPALSITDMVTTTAESALVDTGTPPEASAAVVAAVTKGTCNACHTISGVPGAVGIVGPNLANIGNEAADRIPGYSAEQYLHESIVDPNAFIAPQCPFGSCTAGSMPATLVQTLSEEEITTLVDYMLTLKGGQ